MPAKRKRPPRARGQAGQVTPARPAGAAVSWTLGLELERDGDAAPADQLPDLLTETAAALLGEHGLPATVGRVRRRQGGEPGVEVEFEARLQAGGSTRPDFDPWAFEPGCTVLSGVESQAEFAQRAVAMMLDHNRANIEADGVTLLSSIGMLLTNGMKAPSWLAAAFHQRWGRFERHESDSLDDVFDHQPSTERAREARARHAALLPQVHAELKRIVLSEPETAVDHGLFERAAEALGIGATLCKELYAEAIRHQGLQDLAEMKRLMRSLEPKT